MKGQIHQSGDACNCGAWSGCGHRHLWLRWLVGIAILMFVFCLGVKVGEFKGFFESVYGRGGHGGMYGQPHGMMRYNSGMHYAVPPAASAPATTSAQ